MILRCCMFSIFKAPLQLSMLFFCCMTPSLICLFSCARMSVLRDTFVQLTFQHSNCNGKRSVHVLRHRATTTRQSCRAMAGEIEDFCIPCEGRFTTSGCSWQSGQVLACCPWPYKCWPKTQSSILAGTCYNGECEGLHLSSEERAQHLSWPKPSKPQTIVTAGRFVYLCCSTACLLPSTAMQETAD